MNNEKATTPISSPKIDRAATISTPRTPPSKGKHKRFSGTFLNTPEQGLDHLPFSPSQKRPSSDINKSPGYKLNNSSQSPYTSLKTPRRSGYDSDDEGRLKFQKTPQYFSPGKKLFSDDAVTKEDLSDISFQLKTKLSSALGKLQKSVSQDTEVSSKVEFSDLNFDTSLSPTSKTLPIGERWSPSNSLSQANLNLQTLQKSPIIQSYPTFASSSKFPNSNFRGRLMSDDPEISGSAIEEAETSAHNALMAAISRQRRGSRTSFSGHRRKSSTSSDRQSPFAQTQVDSSSTSQVLQHPPSTSNRFSKIPPLKLPAIDNEKKPTNEQDAVLSLMSLSSPKLAKFSNKPSNVQNRSTSAESSRSSSTVLSSPKKAEASTTALPSLRGIFGSTYNENGDIDNDATDIEEEATDEDSQAD